MGNLRLPPLFLRPSVVRSLVGDLHVLAKGVAAVPLLPIALVDACPAPEITRFDTAHEPASNDEDSNCGRLPVQKSGRARMAARADVSQTPLALVDHREASPHPIPEVPPPSEATAGGHEPDPAVTAPDSASQSAPVLARGEGRPGTRGHARLATRNWEIAAAYAAREDIGEIADRVGLSRSRITAIAIAEGIPPRPVGKNRLIADLDRDAVAEAYATGLSLRVVAEQFGVSKTTVTAIVRDKGGLRPRGQRSPAYRPFAARDAEITEPAPAPEPVQILPPAPPAPPELPLADIEPPRAARPRRAPTVAPIKAEPAVRVLSDSAFDRPTRSALKPDLRAMAERLVAKRAAAAKTDPARLAAAFARKSPVAPKAAIPRPLSPAPSREGCLRCGVPGWKGCDHWLPCEDQPARPVIPEPADRAEAQQFVPKSRSRGQRFTGKRQGIGAMRL